MVFFKFNFFNKHIIFNIISNTVTVFVKFKNTYNQDINIYFKLCFKNQINTTILNDDFRVFKDPAF